MTIQKKSSINLYDGPDLGIWEYTYNSDDDPIFGCVYMDGPGNFWFVAPNWVGPGKLCNNVAKLEYAPVRIWAKEWPGKWRKLETGGIFPCMCCGKMHAEYLND